MPLNTQLLPPINAKSVRDQGKQYYLDAQGVRLPSVTTILNATKPQEDRDRLFNWRQRVGTAEANQISRTASNRGTQTHKQIQRYLQGKDTPCPDVVRPYWQSIEPVLQDIQEVKLIEGSVLHYDLSYGGKVDCVASYKGIPCVCEWKTADKPKGSVERLYDHPLQLTAYMGAVNHYYQDYDLQLSCALLVVAIPEAPAEIFWFDSAEMNHYWHLWEQRVTEYWRHKSRIV